MQLHGFLSEKMSQTNKKKRIEKKEKERKKERKRMTPGSTDISGPGPVNFNPEVPYTTVC